MTSMEKPSPFSRFINWMSNDEMKRANQANNNETVREAVLDVVGWRFERLVFVIHNSDSGAAAGKGLVPALWGDLVARDGMRDQIDTFRAAGGVALNRRSVDGLRPTDFLAKLACQARGTAQWEPILARMHAVQRLGLVFDERTLSRTARRMQAYGSNVVKELRQELDAPAGFGHGSGNARYP